MNMWVTYFFISWQQFFSVSEIRVHHFVTLFIRRQDLSHLPIRSFFYSSLFSIAAVQKENAPPFTRNLLEGLFKDFLSLLQHITTKLRTIFMLHAFICPCRFSGPHCFFLPHTLWLKNLMRGILLEYVLGELLSASVGICFAPSSVSLGETENWKVMVFECSVKCSTTMLNVIKRVRKKENFIPETKKK